jgi:hypothetical protein
MKRSDFLPVALLLPVVGFVAVQAVQTRAAHLTAVSQAAVLAPTASKGEHAGVARDHADHERVSVEDGKVATSDDGGADESDRNLADIRRRLSLGSEGTYMDEILLERDSALARWPDRVENPIRVWVADGIGLADWDDSYPARVREAFEDWSNLGIPVRFTFVVDSSAADVHVTWIDHFDEPISGKTLWSRDRDWWIVNANITLALHHNEGEPLDSEAVKAIALHEVGHLLGLDHTTDSLTIMTPRVRVRELTNEDRATMELLYSLPAGSIK